MGHTLEVRVSKETPMVQEHLESLRCGCGKDHGFTFSPRCHLDAPSFAVYDRHTGTLRLECAVCRQLVATFAVAKGDDASQMAMVN